MDNRILLIGIDEAGYGPILGPLVVSAAAYELPAEVAEASLWQLLQASVTSSLAGRGSKVAILDSKKLYKPNEGLAKLERSVLAVISAWRGCPPNLRGLLNLVSPDVISMLAQYPWYRDANPALPREADAGGIRLASTMLKRDSMAQLVQPAGCWSEVLPEQHYNRLIGKTNNKAVVLSGLTLRLVQRVADAYPDHELRFVIDKQGARDHYGRVLQRSFEDRRLKIVAEGDEHSEYELVNGTSSWRVSFQMGGESKHLPIALASMLSKYLRELLMGCFNDYWREHIPELRRTAGYYNDGLRFLKEIEPHLGRLGIAREQLIRER